MGNHKFQLGEKMDLIAGRNSNAVRDFYQAVGFRIMGESMSATRLTDGSVNLVLGSLGADGYGLFYYTADLDRKIQQLQGRGIRYEEKTLADEPETRCLRIPNKTGMTILIKEITAFERHSPRLVMMKEEDIDHLTDFPNEQCGIFGELSLRVEYLKSAVRDWQQLGYNLIYSDSSNYPWAIMRNDVSIIGLHENKSYDKQALSYFARDMANRLAVLKHNRNLKIAPYGDLTEVVKAGVLQTPDGRYINLFSL